VFLSYARSEGEAFASELRQRLNSDLPSLRAPAGVARPARGEEISITRRGKPVGWLREHREGIVLEGDRKACPGDASLALRTLPGGRQTEEGTLDY